MVAHGESRGKRLGSCKSCGAAKENALMEFSFAPPGLVNFTACAHGSRRGLPSDAAPQLLMKLLTI